MTPYRSDGIDTDSDRNSDSRGNDTPDRDAWDVLADPRRRQILESLTRPQAVVELAARLPISRPAVSQHLKVLKDAGLVAEERHGTRRVYRLEPAAVAAMRDQLDTFWARTLDRLAGLHTDAEDSEAVDPDDPNNKENR